MDIIVLVGFCSIVTWKTRLHLMSCIVVMVPYLVLKNGQQQICNVTSSFLHLVQNPFSLFSCDQNVFNSRNFEEEDLCSLYISQSSLVLLLITEFKKLSLFHTTIN